MCGTVLISALFFSCTTSVALETRLDKTGAVAMQTKLSPSVQTLVSSLAGADSTEALFDAAQIRASLKAAGFAVTGLKFPSKSALTVTAETKNITTMLRGSKDFITVVNDKGINDMRIKLTPENVRKAVAIMPEDTALYIELLIAPIFTGESMSAEEYTDLIAIAYGDKIAQDLLKAKVNLIFTVPGTIISAEMTNSKENDIAVQNSTITMSIPLVTLLTDLKGTECRIRWKE
ncbi:MAG: hypothetical protein MJ159_05780 [Treponemataceae bacterium]|nr:hypothetical protein [Treponemataceae bacterium]